MPTLATAAVEIIADTENFEPELESGLRDAADSASRASENLGRRIGDNIGTGLSRQLGRSTTSLTAAFRRLGASARDSLSGLRSALPAIATSLERVRAGADRTRTALRGLSDSIARSFTGSLGRGIGRSFSVLFTAVSSSLERIGVSVQVAVAAAVAALAVLPAAASVAAAATAAAFGTGIAAIGIVAAAQSEQVQAEFVAMAEHIVDVMTGISGPIERALSSLASDLTSAFDDLTPALEASFVRLGPALEGFFSDLAGSLGGLGPLAEAASDAFADILDALGPALSGSIERVSDALIGLFASSDPQFFADFVSGTFDIVAGLIDLITFLSEARSGLASRFAPAVNAIAPLLSGLGAGLGAVASAVADFTGEFLDEAIPAISTLEPLMADLGGSFESAGELIGSMLGQLTPALDAIDPFIEGFIEGFSEARELMVDFLQAIVDRAGPAGSALESLAEFVGDNEEAVRLLGVVVGTAVAALTTYRLIALSVGVANTILSGSFRAVGVAIRGIPVIGWIITALGLLVIVIQQLWERSETFRSIVTNVWESVSGVFEDAWEVIQDVFDAFSQGWDRIVEAAQTDVGIGRVWEGMQDAISTAWGVIEPIFDQIAQTWNFLVGLISGDRSLEDAGGLLTSYFGNLEEIGQTLGGFIIRQLQRLPGLILDALGFLGGTVGPWLLEQLQELPGIALDGLVELGESIAGWFIGLPDLIAEAVGATEGWLPWLADLSEVALEHLQELGETIAGFIQTIPDIIRERIGDGAAILAWLQELPGRIVEFMQDYGPQILRGFAVAIGIVILGLPALLLGILASILFVLGVIAVEIAQWAWGAFTNMMVRAGEAINAGINNIIVWFQALPGRVLAAIAGFGESLRVWAAEALASMRSSFTSGMNRLSAWWSGVWSGIRTSAQEIFSGFVTWIVTKAGELRDDVMEPINTLASRMTTAFEGAVTSIGKAWDGLRKTVAEPIEWVVNTAYNQWIRGVWEKVIDKFGGPSLPEYTVKMAKGGIFPGGRGGGGVFSGYTPGRDVHTVPLGAFSGGESVLRPEVTRAWGAKTTLMLNKLARMGGVKAVRKALQMLFAGQNPFTGMSVSAPGRAAGGQRFALGGILSTVGGQASEVASWLNSTKDDFSDAMMDFLDDPEGWLRKIFDQVMKYGQMPNSRTTWSRNLRGIPEGIIKKLIEKAKSLFSFDAAFGDLGGAMGGRLGTATAFARAQAGKPYIWGGVGPRGYDCSGFMSAIHNVLVGRRPYSRRYTTHSFVGSTANGFKRNLNSFFRLGNTHASVGHMAGTLGRMNVESRGSAGVVVGARARGANNSLFSSRWGLMGGVSTRGGRMGGEGILYDGGGWLPPGASLVLNKTRKPESIRTDAQERNISRLVRLVGERVPMQGPLVPADRVDDLRRALGTSAVGAGTVINAPVTVTTAAQDPEVVAFKVSARIARLAGM